MSSYEHGQNRNSLLGNMTPPGESLTPPNPPFSIGASGRPNSGISIASSYSPSTKEKGDNRSSLSINYLPSKFSRPHSPGISYRKANTKGGLVKRGGGRDAFADGANRMPGQNDTDYEGVNVDDWFKGKKPTLHWNRFKWFMFATNTLVSAGVATIPRDGGTVFSSRCYFSLTALSLFSTRVSSYAPPSYPQLTAWTIAALIACLLTWFNIWDHADIVRVGNGMELISELARFRDVIS